MKIELQYLYRKMLLIRYFEELLLQLFSQGKLRGTVHTCLGQEACAVGVVSALDPDLDTLCSNHRGHGHFLAFREELHGLLAEILGLGSGLCGGRGGSQHIHAGNFYSNGILGGMVPVATGMAFAQKQKGTHGVSVVFSGDGAMSEGIVYESLNMAALWKIPLLLVIEHNQIAQSTPWTMEHGSPIEGRPAAFGVPTVVVDGNDVEEVYRATREVIAEIRQTDEPRCILLETYRLGPHSKGDDTRSVEEISVHWQNDPIRRAQVRLSAEVQAKMQASCLKQIHGLVTEFDLG